MRPTYPEDLIYAWDLVAKAIEHKALGVQVRPPPITLLHTNRPKFALFRLFSGALLETAPARIDFQ